jgi:hypothetical protein
MKLASVILLLFFSFTQWQGSFLLGALPAGGKTNFFD